MIGWTQPLCETCFAAWMLGRGEPAREPVRVRHADYPCLICGTPTSILTRIDPKLAENFPHPRLKQTSS